MVVSRGDRGIEGFWFCFALLCFEFVLFLFVCLFGVFFFGLATIAENV